MKLSLKQITLSLVVSALVLSISTGCGGGGGGGSSSGSTTPSVVPVSIPTALASVSGSTATAGSGVAAASAFKATDNISTVDTTTSAVLTVDLNANGEYGDSEDIVVTSAVGTDGSFNFGSVKIRQTGETQAQLLVSKQGFAPVTKIITLTDGQSVSVEADAASTPLLTETVNISAIRASGTLSSSFLKFGVKRGDMGLSSYSQIMSLSDMKASADVPISGDVETETVIPLAALPDSVTSVTAETQSFDPTNPEDAKKFPGEYSGVGKPGQGEQRLVSVGFDYMSLTDQNGDPINLNLNQLSAASKLLPQAVDYTSCLRMSTRYLSGAQLDLFKKYGDDDNSTPEFEIPLWYYNSSAGNWQYLGQAEVYEDSALTVDYNVSSTTTTAYAKMCITENWGTSVNLDYSFAPQQPLNMCVIAKDQDNNSISNLYVSAQKDTASDGHYLDKDGKTKIALLAGNTVSDYTFTYSGALTGWNSTTVQGADITVGGEAGCDNTINIEVVNPYSATLRVTAKELNGSLATNKYVTVYNATWGEDYYYNSAYTDENGTATFKVKPQTSYEAYYGSATATVNINGSVALPETADNGRIATVLVQEQEVAPEVAVYMYNNSISDTSKSVNFYVSSSDGNGDAISLKSLKLNGVSLVAGTDYNITNKYSSTGYEYFYAKLNLTASTMSAITPSSLAAGTYSLEATYSDGKNDGKNSQRFTVNANRAPQISSVYLYNSTESQWTYINANIKAGVYDISAYAYDLDADEITLSYKLDDVNLTTNNNVSIVDGEHTLVITATDNFLTTSKTFTFHVGNYAPEITSFGATSYSIDLASQNTTIKLYAYVQDRDRDALTLTASNGIASITMTPSYIGSNYFRSGDIVIDANTTFTVFANDGDKNSTVKSLTVTTYRANQAPVFNQELTARQVAVGSSVEFTCSATDPDGDSVSYAWLVDNVLQSTTTNTFSYIFNSAAVVSCIASDDNVLEPGVATSSASVTVYNPSASGNLVVTTMPGAVVATHNTTTLVPLETKVTGNDGKASFTIVGTDRVTFSVSVAPDLVVTQDMVMKSALASMSYQLDEICKYATPIPDACSAYDRTALLSGTTIPNTLGNLLLANTELNVTAESLDTNSDGALDAAEYYLFMLSMNDTNSDSKLTWAEFNGATQVSSEFYVNVPVQAYDIAFDAYQYHTNVDSSYYGQEWSYIPSTISFSGFMEYVNIFLNGWGTVSTNADGNVTISSDYMFGSNDGLYSYMAYYTDENNVTRYLLGLDKTAAEMASLSFTPADFTLEGTPITFIGATDSMNALSIAAYYKNHYLGGANISNPILVNSAALTYDISGNMQYYDTVNNVYISKNHSNYYGDGTFKSSYNLADYPNLNIEASFEAPATVSFSGSDLSKINHTRVNYYAYASTNNANVNITFNYTVVPSSLTMPDLNQTLPSEIAASLPAALMSENVYVSLNEYKGMSEVDFINAVSTNEALLYEVGVRGVSFSAQLNSAVMPQSTLKEELKTRFVKPFTIGYEAKSAFVR